MRIDTLFKFITQPRGSYVIHNLKLADIILRPQLHRHQHCYLNTMNYYMNIIYDPFSH